MKPIRIIALAGAAVAAIGLAVVVRGALSGEPTSKASAATTQAARPVAKVLVAKRDLKIGERLTDADIGWQDWPLDGLNAAYVTDGTVPLPAHILAAQKAADRPAATKASNTGEEPGALQRAQKAVALASGGGPKAPFLGAVVREPFFAGEPIVDRKLVRAGQSGYMAVVLQPGMRAMAVPVSVESAAGGFILPGDRVDVLLSRQAQSSSGGNSVNYHVSETVLRNVKVLAIDQVTQPDRDATTVVGATATLELAPGDAEALALAKAQGDLSLTLRSYADVAGPSGRPFGDAGYAGGSTSSTVRVFRVGEAVSDVSVTRAQ